LKLTLVATHGTKIRRRRNPKGTRVAKCVRKLKGRKGVKSPIAVCQKATRQSYATGRRLANPPERQYRYRISIDGVRVASFLTLAMAKQYGQALADKTGRQVRLTG
jgi:hypothetical protein